MIIGISHLMLVGRLVALHPALLIKSVSVWDLQVEDSRLAV